MKIICTKNEQARMIRNLNAGGACPPDTDCQGNIPCHVCWENSQIWKIISKDSEWKNHKCRECAYLTGEKCSIGIECKCPYKIFRTKLSHIKQPSGQACSHFVEAIEVINDEEE